MLSESSSEQPVPSLSRKVVSEARRAIIAVAIPLLAAQAMSDERTSGAKQERFGEPFQRSEPLADEE